MSETDLRQQKQSVVLFVSADILMLEPVYVLKMLSLSGEEIEKQGQSVLKQPIWEVLLRQKQNVKFEVIPGRVLEKGFDIKKITRYAEKILGEKYRSVEGVFFYFMSNNGYVRKMPKGFEKEVAHEIDRFGQKVGGQVIFINQEIESLAQFMEVLENENYELWPEVTLIHT